ncbi:hypothetical protein Q9Q95_10790 [Sphingomonas sp. DG1-23]|nr:hypothetical protein [Sphingomonas sp. DG1-23]
MKFAALGLACLGSIGISRAQLAGDGAPLPRVNIVDGAGIDLRSGRRTGTDGAASIGPKESTVSVSVGATGATGSIPLWGYMYYSCAPDETGQNPCATPVTEFSMDGQNDWSEPSLGGGGSFFYSTSDGALTDGAVEGGKIYDIFRRKDGISLYFRRTSGTPNQWDLNPIRGYLEKTILPNGEVYTYNYQNPPTITNTKPVDYRPARPVSIKGSTGLEIRLTQPSGNSQNIALVNNAYVNCGDITAQCEASDVAWPGIQQTGLPEAGGTATFPGASVVSYGPTTLGQIVRHTPSGTPIYEVSNTLTDAAGNVKTQYRVRASDTSSCFELYVTRKVVTPDGPWSYVFKVNPVAVSESGSVGCVVYEGSSTAPDGSTTSFKGDEFTDQLGRKTKYHFWYAYFPSYPFWLPMARGLEGIEYPDGRKVSFEYDQRRNVEKVTEYPRQGSNLAPKVWKWDYPDDCLPTTILMCNKPSTVTDPNNNTTTYTYSVDHGGILTEVGPLVGSVSAAKKYSYAQKYAWLKNAGAGYGQASTPIWVKTEERHCQTSALDLVNGTCSAGAADLVITSYEYQAGNASTPSNVWLKGVAVSANGQVLRTCRGYNKLGDKISETSPRAGSTSCN